MVLRVAVLSPDVLSLSSGALMLKLLSVSSIPIGRPTGDNISTPPSVYMIFAPMSIATSCSCS